MKAPYYIPMNQSVYKQHFLWWS